MSTVCSTGVDASDLRSISRARVSETSNAKSMPAERTPAPAGHAEVGACSRSVSNVNNAIGTDGSSSVFQSIRHHVWVSVSPTATRKMSAPLRPAGPRG